MHHKDAFRPVQGVPRTTSKTPPAVQDVQDLQQSCRHQCRQLYI